MNDAPPPYAPPPYAPKGDGARPYVIPASNAQTAYNPSGSYYPPPPNSGPNSGIFYPPPPPQEPWCHTCSVGHIGPCHGTHVVRIVRAYRRPSCCHFLIVFIFFFIFSSLFFGIFYGTRPHW